MYRTRCRTRRRRSERGAAAVEMALVLPILLFLVFGIVDFGRLLNAQITLTEAAREGARAEALNQSANTRVQAASGNLQGVTTTLTPSTGCPTPYDPANTSADAVVTTTYTFTFITPIAGIARLFGGTFNGSKVMTGKGVMPCQA